MRKNTMTLAVGPGVERGGGAGKWLAAALLVLAVSACGDQSAAEPPDAGRELVPLIEADVARRGIDSAFFSAIGEGDLVRLEGMLGDAKLPVAELQAHSILAIAASQRPCVPEVLSLFLDYGVDPNHPDPATGSTALHAAAGAGSKQCVDLLIAQGADTALVNIQSQGLVASAYLSGSPELFEHVLLLPDDKALNPEDLAATLRAAIGTSDWTACGRLLKAGASPTTQFMVGSQAGSIMDLPEGAMLVRCELAQ